MFENNDEQYLLRVLSQNKVILFLGAGSTSDAINSLGSTLPVGSSLASDLWDFLNYPGEYDGTPLPDIYEAALSSGIKESLIKEFMESRLICTDVPQSYDALAKVFWHRIYTTNIDNLLDVIYKRVGESKLEVISYPDGEPCDRDQTLNKIQAIYLHGRLPCKPNELTFSVRQYAQRANIIDPLYEQFVRDYSTHPTIFIGTQLNEPLFWQYIEAREMRRPDISENRPKSFLISPRISPPKKTQLKTFNIIPIEGTVSEFLAWLDGVYGKLPSRMEILRTIVPDIAAAIESESISSSSKRSLTSFSEFFHRVPVDLKSGRSRSLYLLGASPQWEDILSDLDAPRSITERIFNEVNKALERDSNIQLFALLGSAGCGKSTILRRLGVNLSRSGRMVYLTNSEELPKPSDFAKALDAIPKRTVLLFDNAEIALNLLPAICSTLANVDRPPIILFASRTNDFDRKIGKFTDNIKIHEVHIPRLRRKEIIAIIEKLEENSLLGRLQGLNSEQRIKEFEERADKQILVAMREATSGYGFDQILKDEFQTLVPDEAKILYLCVALATEAGYRITKQEFVGCARTSPAEALHLLARNLRDIVITSGVSDELLMLRHKTIAEYAIDGFAPRPILREAYIRLLRVLASETIGKHWRTRTFGLYRDLINHLTIYTRFENDIDEARSIYDALQKYLRRDAQFWLQYGSLELEDGNLQFAENYINAAESIDPDNTFIQNAKGHLLIKKGIEAESLTEATSLRDEGSEILLNNIYHSGINDAHCYHIYCSQRHKWMHKWVLSDQDRIVELEHLRSILKKGLGFYPRNRQLNELDEMIEREYLSMAVSK